MARKIDDLNRELGKRIKAGKPNLWSHGNGLCFALAKNGKATWVIRYTVNAKGRVMTLEPHADPITERKLKELEMVALECRDKVKAGIDPLAERDTPSNRLKTASADTFECVARDYIAIHSANWRNAKHADPEQAASSAWRFSDVGENFVPKIGRGCHRSRFGGKLPKNPR